MIGNHDVVDNVDGSGVTFRCCLEGAREVVGTSHAKTLKMNAELLTRSRQHFCREDTRGIAHIPENRDASEVGERLLKQREPLHTHVGYHAA